jgi:peptidyl-prolyl cis-trans isomerase D
MATLQKIRNRAGILISIFVGFALLAFILGDALSSGPSAFSKKRLEVAEINGESIDYRDYTAKIEELSDWYRANYQMNSLDQETMESIKDEIWRTTVRDIIMGEAYEDLGVYISVEELKTMLTGDSISTGGTSMVMDEPHPIVRRMFTNPETGEFNRFQMMNYFNALSDPVYADMRKQWIYLEDQIVKERLSQKYFGMVRKGLSPNSLDAKNFSFESESSISFDFAYLGFNTIEDSEIEVSQSDISSYYNAHKNEFRQEESRSVEYIIFPIEPSDEDDSNARMYVEQKKDAFARTDNPINFVNSNSDLPYADVYYAKEELPAAYQDSIFNAQPGYIAGPYYENNSYKLTRLIGFEPVPDSVRARHILISLSVQRDDERAKTIADSLKNLIQNGASFNTLASEFSADQSNSAIGGDLGWFSANQMVKPINDYCFNGNKGDLGVVKTNFGYHVIRIEDQSEKVRKAKLAILESQVTASDQTRNDIYSEAVQFNSNAGDIEGFRKLYAQKGLSPRFATDFAKDAKSLPGLENSREIIRWAFENEEGTISKEIFDLDEKYIVVALTDVKEEGIASLEDKTPEIEIEVRKDKKLEKLAAQMTEKLASVSEIDAAAVALDTEVKTAEAVRFSNPYVNMVGLEPAVVAKAFDNETDQLSGPIIGENGVFVIQITEKNVPEEFDISSAKFRMKYLYESRVNFQGYEALMEEANIKDNRIKFF